ncbi:MAG: hypothetical protein JRF63_07945 [Deltaproteobacteria bacterium]|nr:hypothetical protein [Deltaproteobacteria bacterium]
MPQRLRRVSTLGVALAALLLAAHPAVAVAGAGVNRQDEKFHVLLGLFRPHVTTTARLDSQTTGIGTEIDFESNLGLDDSTVSPLVGFAWRFTKRSVLMLNYMDLDRSGVGVTDINIKWGDIEIPINTEVESFFRTEIVTISYGYRFHGPASGARAVRQLHLLPEVVLQRHGSTVSAAIRRLRGGH